MILGRGDIASVLTDKPDRIYFASGVSNSSCTDWHEFQREKKLLLEQNRFQRLVYFSSLCIYYSDTPYSKHKLQMEAMAKRTFNEYTIIRLGNITWGKNPNTLINYLSINPQAERKDVYRYLIDKDEFLHWMDMIPDFNTEMNITGKLTNVKTL